jgi:hypothetical protein
MATRTWNGGGNDGDWDNTSNWEGGNKPGASDDVVIAVGADAIVDGLDQSSITVASLSITFGQNIGTAAASLEINVSGECLVAGRGSSYKIDGDIGVLKIQLPPSSECSLVGGTTTSCDLVSGNLAIEANATVTSMFVNGGSATALAGTVFTALTVNSGSMDSTRGATTAYVASGRLIAKGSGAWATAFLFMGGIFDIRTSGTIGTLNANSGSTTLIKNSTVQPTVTTLNQRGTADVQKNAAGITLSPGTEYIAAAG